MSSLHQHQVVATAQHNQAAVEQYQKHLTMKDQEIVRLRSQVDNFSSDVFTK